MGGVWEDLTGQTARNDAQKAQSQATSKANEALGNTYAQQGQMLQPYRVAGENALNQLSGGNLVDTRNLQMDQGYQFRLGQGENAINNAMASRGMGNSGAALKALTEHGQNFATQEYDNAYNREYNRLNQLAGMGLNSSNNLATAAGAYGSNLSNNYMGLGNASAAASMGQYNAMAGLGGQALGLGAAIALSDERYKKNITAVSDELLSELRKELKAFYYEYKNELDGSGRYLGIMAQDLEKTKLGKEIVVEVDGKKMIDMNRLLFVFLATMAEGEAA